MHWAGYEASILFWVSALVLNLLVEILTSALASASVVAWKRQESEGGRNIMSQNQQPFMSELKWVCNAKRWGWWGGMGTSPSLQVTKKLCNLYVGRITFLSWLKGSGGCQFISHRATAAPWTQQIRSGFAPPAVTVYITSVTKLKK